MNLLHISDWHTDAIGAAGAIDRIKHPGNTPRLQSENSPDVIIVTGDMVVNTINHPFPELEAEDQNNIWGDIVDALSRRWPQAEIVAVPGNHDYGDYKTDKAPLSIDNGAGNFTLNGVRFTGFRGVPLWHGDWNREYSEKALEFLIAGLDPNADILLTHTPPIGILDFTRRGVNAGCVALRKWLFDSKVKLHCFGHIHEAKGKYSFETENGTKICSNASLGWNFLKLKD